jgi:hypothetical protein
MTTVVVVDEAQQQLREIVEWWIANRTAAPTLALTVADAKQALVGSG